MLDEATLKAIAFHETIHTMGMCTCPCLPALFTVAAKIGERDAANQLQGTLVALGARVVTP